jgi:hypothetical protein
LGEDGERATGMPLAVVRLRSIERTGKRVRPMNQNSATISQKLQTALDQVRSQLNALAWDQGLTRNDIRAQIPDFPLILYLRLPDAKRYLSAREVAHAVLTATQRADGEFLTPDASVELPSEQEMRDMGAPPAWGQDPLLAGGTEDSGSATDTEGLDAGTDENSELQPPE